MNASFLIKHVLSAVAAVAVLAMVLSSVFADVTSVARAKHDGGRDAVPIVSALGL
jgi:hypothetical protein